MNLEAIKKLMYKQDFREAEKILQKSLRTEKDKFMVFYFLGLVYFELRILDKSIQFFEESLKFNPSNIAAINNFANSLSTSTP